MFLCINANAAIDKTLIVPGFTLDRIQRPERVLLLAGGKGINVARGLQTLGETAVVSGWAGGYRRPVHRRRAGGRGHPRRIQLVRFRIAHLPVDPRPAARGVDRTL